MLCHPAENGKKFPSWERKKLPCAGIGESLLHFRMVPPHIRQLTRRQRPAVTRGNPSGRLKKRIAREFHRQARRNPVMRDAKGACTTSACLAKTNESPTEPEYAGSSLVTDVVSLRRDQPGAGSRNDAGGTGTERQAHRSKTPVPPEIKAKIQAIRTRVLDKLIANTEAREQEEVPEETPHPTSNQSL